MSNLTTLARPYAKAAFSLANEQSELAGWDSLLGTVGAIVSDETVADLLRNPEVSREQCLAIITDALGEGADKSFTGFLSVLGENKRLSLLPEISSLFSELRHEAEKRLRVRVVSAIELESSQAAQLEQALARRFDREIEMENIIDASVLGGAIVYAGDQVIDGSLLGRLEKLQAGLA